MSGKTAIVWTCAHTDPEVSNERFDWLGSLIEDIRPDYTIDLGDTIDFKSLNSYDTRYPQAIVSQNYERDIEQYQDAMERIWGRFRQKKKKRPYRIGFEGNHCVPENTDVLVEGKGWVNIKGVIKGDRVMSLEGWTPVTETHKVHYNGPLYKFGDRSSVSYVTSDHRVYYYNGSGRLEVKMAKDCPTSLDLPVSTVTGVGVPLTDEQIRFNAVAMTDSYHLPNGRGIVFYQSGDKAKVIEQIIQDCGVEYKKTARNRDIKSIMGKKLKSVQTSYEFHMKEKPSWCVTNNKEIPEWAFDMTEAQFEVLLETLVFCDGSIPTRATSSRVFYGRKEICESLQAICTTKGYRATLTEYRSNHWRVNIAKAYKCRAKKVVVDTDYNNWVYCLTTETQNFLMRQDYKPVFTGNCHRVKKALAHDPRIEGGKYGISFSHLATDYWYDEYHEYSNSAPAIFDYDGVSYSHYFSSGNYGTATSGTHHAYTILQNRNHSSTCGHSHKRSVYFKDGAHPSGIIGLVAGCFKGGQESWAGQANLDWWKGVVVKRNIENGMYDPEFISMERLRAEYG